MSEHLYTSDSHIDHENIIKYCRRPFQSVLEMNVRLLAELTVAEGTGRRILHCGDFAMNLRAVLAEFNQIFRHPERHAIVIGNHDQARGGRRVAYEESFGLVVGTEKTWRENILVVEDRLARQAVRVLISHRPQPDSVLDTNNVDFNVYGHHHNNLWLDDALINPEEKQWLLASSRHLNAGVELHHYRPVKLEELVKLQQYIRAGGTPVWEV